MTKTDIMQELDALGIEYDPTAKKADLEELLDQHRPSEDEELEQEDSVEEDVEVSTEEQAEDSEEDEADHEVDPEPEKMVEQEPEEGYVLLENVKYDGTFYDKGQRLLLSDQDAESFRKQGLIE